MQKDAKIFVAGHADWQARPSCASSAHWATRNLVLRTRQEVDLLDCECGEQVFRRAASGVCVSCRGQGGRHSRQSRLPCRLHRPESAHPKQRDRKRLPHAGQAVAVPRIKLHLSEAGAATDRRRSTAGRAAGVHQPLLCGGKDCRNRAVLGVQPAARDRLSGGDADQPLRAGRQLRSGKFARSARADSQGA